MLTLTKSNAKNFISNHKQITLKNQQLQQQFKAKLSNRYAEVSKLNKEYKNMLRIIDNAYNNCIID